jgi:hypothetical protein
MPLWKNVESPAPFTNPSVGRFLSGCTVVAGATTRSSREVDALFFFHPSFLCRQFGRNGRHAEDYARMLLIPEGHAGGAWAPWMIAPYHRGRTRPRMEHGCPLRHYRRRWK